MAQNVNDRVFDVEALAVLCDKGRCGADRSSKEPTSSRNFFRIEETMPAGPLPTKLEKEPLVDAVFEIRFNSHVPASTVIPGILFTRLETHPQQIERLPVADLPPEFRIREPSLRFQPVMRLHWDENFLIMIGDTTLGLGCKMPYPGWKNFKPHILTLAGALKDSEIIEQIERYSIKYIGVIEGRNAAEQIGSILLEVKFGDYALKSEPFSLRVEMKRDSLRHIVQLAAPATTSMVDGTKREGLLVDIDSICEHTTTDIGKASGAGQLHPRALSEPDVILSHHPAPIVRPRP